jgi:hypothetical protein
LHGRKPDVTVISFTLSGDFECNPLTPSGREAFHGEHPLNLRLFSGDLTGDYYYSEDVRACGAEVNFPETREALKVF